MSDRDRSDRVGYEAALAELDPAADLIDAEEMAGGVSAHVVLVRYRTADGGERQAVFRQHRSDLVKRKEAGLASTEFATLRVLHAAGLAVPEPLALVEGTDGLPPSLVMQFVEGTTSVERADLDASLDEIAEFLAALHRLDPAPLEGVLPTLEDPVERLPAHLPPDRRGEAIRRAISTRTIDTGSKVIVHGDYWPGNVLWADGRLAAVLDWEDAGLGDPLADLATARLELLCRYGQGAMQRFTSAYVGRMRSGPDGGLLRLDHLPVWEMSVSATSLASMHMWGLAADDQARRRSATRRFFDRAAEEFLRTVRVVAGPRRRRGSLMRIGIVGAGGIGGYLAAQLIGSDVEVALIARGAHGAAIGERGLTLVTPEGERVVRPALVTDDPGSAGECDLVIPAVKAHQLAGALEAMRPMMGASSQALTFQNGVEAPDMAARAYGRERALIGVARIFVNITGPGEVTLREGFRSFVIGDIDGAQDGRAASVISTFRSAGIDAPDRSDVRVDLWQKFLLFNAVSSTTAGARTTMGVVQRTPELWGLFTDLVRETEALARAMRVELPEGAGDGAIEVGTTMPAGARASTAHDLDEGRALESDWICGAVARLGEQYGVSVPASRTIAALLAPHRGGGSA